MSRSVPSLLAPSQAPTCPRCPRLTAVQSTFTEKRLLRVATESSRDPSGLLSTPTQGRRISSPAPPACPSASCSDNKPGPCHPCCVRSHSTLSGLGREPHGDESAFALPLHALAGVCQPRRISNDDPGVDGLHGALQSTGMGCFRRTLGWLSTP